MCSMPSYWKHVNSTSARIFNGWGVMRRLMFFSNASRTCATQHGSMKKVRLQADAPALQSVQRIVCTTHHQCIASTQNRNPCVSPVENSCRYMAATCHPSAPAPCSAEKNIFQHLAPSCPCDLRRHPHLSWTPYCRPYDMTPRTHTRFQMKSPHLPHQPHSPPNQHRLTSGVSTSIGDPRSCSRRWKIASPSSATMTLNASNAWPKMRYRGHAMLLYSSCSGHTRRVASKGW